ncbi:hypothetical protein HN51_054464 [Arachis hypogaea]
MVSAALVRTVIGIIGNVISFGLFFSPAPTFYQIIKKKSVEEFKPDPTEEGTVPYGIRGFVLCRCCFYNVAGTTWHSRKIVSGWCTV